jgi:peptide/nickel transport system substrate-binding protein
VFTVTLKPDIVYSDGTPFTAGDVKTLFDTYVFGETSTLKGNVASIMSTEAPDDLTVVFTLASPQAPFPALLTNIPIWKPEPGLTQTSLPIGTGPFMFDSWEPNVQTTLVKNPNYWGTDAAGNKLPYLDEIVFTPITSGDTRVNAIESGEVDVAMSTDPLVTSTFEDVATVSQLPLNAGGGLFFNNSSAPTDDVRVRQALAYATNKVDILEAIGGGEPRSQYYVPDSAWFSPEADEATPSYDPDRAKELLDEYINDPARSDGKAVGEPLSIDISHVQGAITQESVAVLAQQQWGDVGVEVSITPKDQSTLIGDAIAGNFNVNYFGWATPHPFSLLTRNYGHWPETPSNYTHFNSDEVIQIVADMSTAGSTEEIDELVRQSNLIFAEQVPLIFLHSTAIGWASNDNVGNLELLPGNGILDWPTLSTAG